jgi:alpha-beta hydrolase superfamily lysophospholipase
MSPFEIKRPDGCTLRGFTWPAREARTHAVIVHGLGEHAMRYAALAQWLNSRGVTVHAYDQRGHGKSDGARGALAAPDNLLQDACAVIDYAAALGGTPPLLLGHSMGGLVVASILTKRARPLRAAVLSSPALDLGLNIFQKMLLAVLPRIAPNLAVDNGLKVDKISHSAEVVERYQKDPLVHPKATGRLVAWMAATTAAVAAQARNIEVPTLLMYASADELVKPAGSRRFAKSADPKLVQAVEIKGAYHEIFNEAEPWRTQTYEALGAWFDHISQHGRV